MQLDCVHRCFSWKATPFDLVFEYHSKAHVLVPLGGICILYMCSEVCFSRWAKNVVWVSISGWLDFLISIKGQIFTLGCIHGCVSGVFSIQIFGVGTLYSSCRDCGWALCFEKFFNDISQVYSIGRILASRHKHSTDGERNALRLRK